jgi:hypothetical protein
MFKKIHRGFQQNKRRLSLVGLICNGALLETFAQRPCYDSQIAQASKKQPKQVEMLNKA